METIFSSNQTIPAADANPVVAGFANLFSPSTSTASTMGQVADALMGNPPAEQPKIADVPADPNAPKSLAEAIEAAQKSGEIEDTENPKNTGRPKSDKNVAVSYIADRAKEGKIALFSDYDESVPVEEYLNKLPQNRLYELFDKNIENARQSAIEEIQQSEASSFYESLPPEFRAMYEYAANGGNDWSTWAQNMQGYTNIQQLDPTNDDHQSIIARNYLEATNFGTPQMIQEQIQEWANDGKIGNKAQQFKPLLENMYQQNAQRMAYEQQQYALQQQQYAQEYHNAVVNTLKKGEIAGIKINQSLQKDLYRGLTQVAEEWGNTNELEYLWNKVNFEAPNHEKIAMAHWLLKDTDGFLNAIRQSAKNEAATETFNELKRLNVKGTGGTNIVETPAPKQTVKKLQPTWEGLWR